MKRIVFFVVINLSLIFSGIVNSNQNKCVKGSEYSGFFSQFFRVLNHLEYCKSYNKIPVIHWGNEFAYYKPSGYKNVFNAWEYYFEPVSDLTYDKSDYIHREVYYPSDKNFSAIWWYCQIIENIDLLTEDEKNSFISIDNHKARYLSSSEFNGQRAEAFPCAQHIYSKSFRKYVKEELIDRYIVIKPLIFEKMLDFYTNNFMGKRTIGIHLRGGHLFNEVLKVPISELFREANAMADENCQFFIATDQRPLLEEAKKQLNGPVIYYECERFNATTSPYAGTKKLDPKLGEDILIEMWLLSQCDHLIHTMSNVSTAALYFNPDLPNTLIY